tara:strand:+ start:1995 stop:2585 length:591 start_codon:yes stop_codon:yes gene_type:complete
MKRKSFNNFKKEKLIFRYAYLNDFDQMIKIIDNYYEKNNLIENMQNKNKPPWIWINDENVIFKLMIYDEKILGFFISRNINMNCHLHSFFIEKQSRGCGLGEKLLIEHWRTGFKYVANIKTFTLHVHSINKKASKFYEKFKYKEVAQSKDLLLDNGGLGSWARNCKDKDQWPLKDGIDLYYLSSKKIKALCDNYQN